ncbi:sensor kinase CusS [Abditibacteriota bacterium]|nr:sensor kinase CusS [Abditibacteriota bacterium]
MRARMTAQFALFVAALLLLGCMAEWREEKERAENRVKEILSVAKTRANYEFDEEEDDGDHSILSITREAQGEISVGGLALLVVDEQNRVLWRSRHQTPSWPDYGENWRAQTISRGGQTLVLARDWKPTQKELNHIALTMWRMGLLVLVVTALGAWCVVGRTLSPIEKLALQARDASTESLQVRLHPPSSDTEMYRLTETLNGLLARLENDARLRGRFYAAASHELRTPIQGLLGNLDVARSRSRSAAEYEVVIVGLQGATERLAALVENLLQLNALEMGQIQSPLETINLAFWVERALEQQNAEIEARSLKVEAHLQDALIEAPSFHVEILLRNLMENAVKYATSSTLVLVCLKETTDGAQLSIENTADVPTGTDVSQWFEPFFRMDASRSSLTGGNGLGLAIVETLAHANGWKVELEAEGGKVLTHVWLPKTPKA